MHALYAEAQNKAHPPRTLDSYIDKDLRGEWLIRYDTDQVLSRSLHKRHEQGVSQRINPLSIARLQTLAISLLAEVRDWLQRSMTGICRTIGSLPYFCSTAIPSDIEQSATKDEGRFQQYQIVLVVSQLWLFKLGGGCPIGSHLQTHHLVTSPCFSIPLMRKRIKSFSMLIMCFKLIIIDTLISSYPERFWRPCQSNARTSSKESGFSGVLRAMANKGIRDRSIDSSVLFHSIVAEAMKFEAEIPPALLRTEIDERPTTVDIATQASETQTTGWPFTPTRSEDRSLSYLEVFDGDIMRIVSFCWLSIAARCYKILILSTINSGGRWTVETVPRRQLTALHIYI